MEEFYHRNILTIINQAHSTIVSAVSRIAEAAQPNISHSDRMWKLSQLLETIRGARVEVDKALMHETEHDLIQLTETENSDVQGPLNDVEKQMLILVEEGFNGLIDATRDTMGAVYREAFFTNFTKSVTSAIDLTTKKLEEIREMRASDQSDERKLQFAEAIIRTYSNVLTKSREQFNAEAETLTSISDLEDTMLPKARDLTASVDKLMRAVLDDALALKSSISSRQAQQPLSKQKNQSRRPG
jgi:hypothetical protein